MSSVSLYTILALIFTPVFISLDFSNGIMLDAWSSKIVYSRPSIPLSLLFVVFSSMFFIKDVLKKEFITLIILISIYCLLNLYYGTTRAIIVGVGMCLPITSFYIFKSLLQKSQDLYKRVYLTIFTIIVLKYVFDFYYIHILGLFDNSYFSTQHYILRFVNIYSYEDYFPFIYYLATVLSIYNILNKKMFYASLLLIIISNLAIIDTGSRLFIYSLYLIPALYAFFYMTNLKLKIYFYLFMLTSLVISFAVGMVDFNLSEYGYGGLARRNSLLYNYFHEFSWINIIFPFATQSRLETSGSFHNEIFEIFSFFGLVVIYYYHLILKIFLEVADEYKLISFFLMFVIVIGSLIQINISNPYVGIMFGVVLAVLSQKNQRKMS